MQRKAMEDLKNNNTGGLAAMDSEATSFFMVKVFGEKEMSRNEKILHKLEHNLEIPVGGRWKEGSTNFQNGQQVSKGINISRYGNIS